MLETIMNIVPIAIGYTAPLLLIALGGLFSERSGVVNIGLEGLLGVGAFSAAFFIQVYFPLLGDNAILLGLVVAAIAGGLFSLLHAFACVTMRADQVISGTAINLLSIALTIFLARSLAGSANIHIVKGFIKRDVPGLSEIPVIGGLFFHNAYITTLIVLIVTILSWYVLYYRPFGLHLRACGEHPQAAATAGINVIRMRYIGVFLSGVLAGVGGAIVITTYSGEFSPLVYNGLGFLALAALIFGKWHPWKVMGAAAFFGFAKTIADMSQLFSNLSALPDILFNTFPFVATLLALVIFSKNAAGPKAAGEPYDPGKR